MRNVLGAVAGIATALLTVWLIQWLGQIVFPLPEGLDPNDTEAFAAYVAEMPVAPLILVLVSYFIGTFDGVFVACLIGRIKPILYGLLVAVVMLAATGTTLLLIPHPMWFSASALIGIVLMAWLAALVASKTVARTASKGL